MDQIKKIVLGLLAVMLLLAGCSTQKNGDVWIKDSAELPEDIKSINEQLKELGKHEATERYDAWTAEFVGNSHNQRNYDLLGLQVNIEGGFFVSRQDSVFIEKTQLKDFIPVFRIDDNAETGEVVVSAPTYFYDDNGLLCIQIKCVFHEQEDCRIIKSYYYLNGNKYDEESTVPARILRENTQVFIPMQTLMQVYGFYYEEDKAEGYVRMSGGNLSCENAVNTVYEPIALKTVGGRVWNTAGKLVPTEQIAGEEQKNRYTAIPLEYAIPVFGNEKLKVTMYSGWFSKVASLLFLDDTNSVVGLLSTERSENFEETILVPKDATKMLMSLYSFQKYSLAREVTYRGADLSTVSKEEYNENMHHILEANKEATLSGVPETYKFDKGYVSFVIDDLRPDVDQIVNIFEEYGIPVCIAAPGGFMNCGSLGEKSLYEVCLQVIKNGGEILAHNGEVITEDNIDDPDTMFDVFYGRKFELERYGFSAEGIILSGGTGQIVGDSRTDIYARNIYRYSDLYGEEILGEPYYHRRGWITHVMDDFRGALKKVMGQKEWAVYYFHDLKEVSEEQLRDILDEVKKAQEQGLEVVNYSQIYQMMHEE